MGADNDVAQVATKISTSRPQDLTQMLLKGKFSLSGEAPWEKSLGKSIPSTDKSLVPERARKLIEEEGRPTTNRAGEIFEAGKPIAEKSLSVLQRAGDWNQGLGQTVDNVGRWTLFLDRLEKGETAAAAALATKR